MNEVIKNDEQDLAIFQGAESGFEGTSAKSFKTPFVTILQQLSPELKKTDPKFIPGAELGMFCNTATQQLYKAINVVVVKIEHAIVVWKPDRGGFVGRYPKAEEESILASEDGLQKWDKDGNSIIDTLEFYCINLDDPSDVFILPISKASLKHGKSFATRLRMLKYQGKPANVSWAGVWKISTVEESNKKGTWFTIGSTPEFIRFITMEDKVRFVSPAQNLLKKAVTDYTTVESSAAVEDIGGDTINEGTDF